MAAAASAAAAAAARAGSLAVAECTANTERLLTHPMRNLGWFSATQERFMVARVAEALDPRTVTPDDLRRANAADAAAADRGRPSTSLTCRGIRPAIEGATGMHSTHADEQLREHVDSVLVRQATERTAVPARKRRRRRRGIGCLGASACEHGTIVHAQMEEFVKCWQATVARIVRRAEAAAVPLAAGYSHEQVEREAVEQLEREAAASPHGGVDQCVYDVLEVCASHGWLPVVSEYMVYDTAHRLATCADLICMDRDRRLVLVELKTHRSQSSANTSTGACWNPPQLENPLLLTNLMTHTLQLLATQRMLELWGIVIHRAAVVHVAPRSEPCAYELPRAYADLLKGILWEHVCVWRNSELASADRRRRRSHSRSLSQPPARTNHRAAAAQQASSGAPAAAAAAAAAPPARETTITPRRAQRQRTKRRNARQMRANLHVQW